MDRLEIKNLAKRQIGPNIGIIVILYIIVYAIYIASSSLSTIVSSALAIIFELSLFSIYLNLAEGNPPDVKGLFYIFRNAKLCGNGILLYLLISIFTFLWSLLLVIPGIIKSLSYSMAPYILLENEYYMTPMDAIKESQRIMDGHKMELFLLELSFIGWCLLGILTFGLIMFYVEPYINMTFVNFYNTIKDKPEIQ